MAKKPAEQPAELSATSNRYKERRWMKPSKRAKGYAEERKLSVHKFGKKEGEELTEYDKGLRSGYLLCQSEEAFEISKTKGKRGA